MYLTALLEANRCYSVAMGISPKQQLVVLQQNGLPEQALEDSLSNLFQELRDMIRPKAKTRHKGKENHHER